MTTRTEFAAGVFALFVVPVLFAAPDSFGTDSFNRLGDEEKQAFVLAVLRDRDAQLQNFSYEMTDTLFRFTPKDGKTEFRRKTSIGLKRKGTKLLLNAETVDSEGRLNQYVVNWDGSFAKSLLDCPYGEVTRTGSIRDEVDNNFKYRAYNHTLGLFLLDTPNLSLPEFLEESISKGNMLDINTSEENGKPIIDVKVTRGNKYWQWFLDVERDYMPIRAEIQYKMGENYNSDSSVVEEAIEVDGFWVPTKVFRTTGTSVSDGQPRIYYEISTFARNTVKDEDLEIEFPPGTEVVDTIANIAYRVLSGGGMELLPLYDPASGEVINPGKPMSGGEVIDPGNAMTVDAALEGIVTDSKDEGEPTPTQKDKLSDRQPDPNRPPVVSTVYAGGPWIAITIAMIGIGVLVLLVGIKLARSRCKQNSCR